MRTLATTLSAAVALLVAAVVIPASASAACVQATPCPLAISFNDKGFTDSSKTDFTKDDWWEIDFSNEDNVNEAAHTITLSGYSLDFTVNQDQTVTKTMQFTSAGCFKLKDMPSGAVRNVRVYIGDSQDVKQSVSTETDPCGAATSGAGGKTGTPGFELSFLVVGLAAAVAMRRRA